MAAAIQVPIRRAAPGPKLTAGGPWPRPGSVLEATASPLRGTRDRVVVASDDREPATPSRMQSTAAMVALRAWRILAPSIDPDTSIIHDLGRRRVAAGRHRPAASRAVDRDDGIDLADARSQVLVLETLHTVADVIVYLLSPTGLSSAGTVGHGHGYVVLPAAVKGELDQAPGDVRPARPGVPPARRRSVRATRRSSTARPCRPPRHLRRSAVLLDMGLDRLGVGSQPGRRSRGHGLRPGPPRSGTPAAWPL